MKDRMRDTLKATRELAVFVMHRAEGSGCDFDTEAFGIVGNIDKLLVDLNSLALPGDCGGCKRNDQGKHEECAHCCRIAEDRYEP